jgi:hypothetical protein
MNDLDRFTDEELYQLHASTYQDIQARLDKLEHIPAWMPARRIGLAAVREQNEHLCRVGAVLRARWDAARTARKETP